MALTTRTLSLIFLALLLVAPYSIAAAARDDEPFQTAISCQSPNNRLEFSVYSINLGDPGPRRRAYQISTYNHSNAFNPEPLHIPAAAKTSATTMNSDLLVAYGADVNGSMAIHSTLLSADGKVGLESSILLSGYDSNEPSQRASLYDHIRFQPIRGGRREVSTRKRRASGSEEIVATSFPEPKAPATMAFVSTKEPNEFSDVGWTALYVGKAFDPFGQGIQRLSPRHTMHADYSPAWSPNGQWIAVARGAGKPGGTNISIYPYPPLTTEPEEPYFVVENGGWPTWSGDNKIIFHRNTGTDIWDRWDLHSVELIFSADGSRLQSVSGPKIVLRGGLTPYVPAFASDFMAFAFFDHEDFRQIGWMNLTTQEKHQLTFEPTHHYNPSIDQEANIVLFHKQRCNSLTPNLRRSISGSTLIHDMIFIHGDFPSISPDGTQISFTGMHDRGEGGFSAIDVMNVDGSDRKRIYNATQTWMTSWVKGNRIAATMGPAFQAADDARVQVISLNSDGSDVKQLTNSTHQNQGYPCFSPNGTKIVYRTNVGMHKSDWNGSHGFPGPYHLQIMDEDGSNKRNLTIPGQTDPADFNLGDTHPHWGPNGTIIFASDRGHAKRLTIWIINEDGTNMTEVFDDGALNVHPAFTSDGKHMVFTSSLAGYSTEQISWPHVFWPKAELFTANLDGTDVQRVTHDFAQNANVWVGIQRVPAVLSDEGLPTRCTYTDAHDPPGKKNIPNNKHNHSAYHGSTSSSGEGEEDTAAEVNAALLGRKDKNKGSREVPDVRDLLEEMILEQRRQFQQEGKNLDQVDLFGVPEDDDDDDERTGRPFPHGSEDVERKRRQDRFMGLKPDDFLKPGKKRSGGGCPFLSRFRGGGQ